MVGSLFITPLLRVVLLLVLHQVHGVARDFRQHATMTNASPITIALLQSILSLKAIQTLLNHSKFDGS